MSQSANYDKFRSLLRELFMFDRADLDFGIYRIMNAKREEIERFLEKDLLPQVREILEKATGSKDQKILDALEAEVFADLYNFFRRYYKDGDFISLRRYKAGVYAIPYEGEEVKLYWANRDQHYIKSSENFRDYRFKLDDGRTVHFKLVEAGTESANNKAAAGQERRFILAKRAAQVDEATGELVIPFEYRVPDEKGVKQAGLNDVAVAAVMAGAPGDWLAVLAAARPTDKNARRTLLEKHLSAFTARNTFDYFIHKDLGGFLNRELDFFIKNEVLHLEDLETTGASTTATTRSRADRLVGGKIIALLAQLEEFQKKLWLKKKFVVETSWCVSLDHIPESLYAAIAGNERQRERWVGLFAIDRIEASLGGPAYSEPLTVEFLKANPTLIVDSSLFGAAFTSSLLSAVPNLNEIADGQLFCGDNFQALNLLQDSLRGSVDIVFIDPPYNTGGDGFAYKDSYQHSSWLSMMADRVALARKLLSPSGSFFASIDDNEHSNLTKLLDEVFGAENCVADIIWQKKYAPANDAKWFSDDHDYIVCYARDKEGWRPGKLDRSDSQDAAYKNPDSDPRGPWKSGDYTCNKSAEERPNLYYAIVNPNTGEEVLPSRTRVWAFGRDEHERNVSGNRLWWGANGKNRVPSFKRFLSDVGGVVPRTIWTHQEAGHNQDAVRELQAMFGVSPFASPKPTKLMRRILDVAPGTVVLDFFAGSGTTGAAAIQAKREGRDYRYALVEVGEHFDTVLKPRILKAAYSSDWKDGAPVSRDGLSHVVKCVRIEGYEDALANLKPRDTGSLERLTAPAHEDYMLRYALSLDASGASPVCGLDVIEDPWSCQLAVSATDSSETVERAVDVIETFSYLGGFRAASVYVSDGVTVLKAVNPAGVPTMLCWRRIAEVDNAELNRIVLEQLSGSPEIKCVYANGPHTLDNLPGAGERFTVRQIEEDFARLMFDVREV